jgi:hypothetical protein
MKLTKSQRHTAYIIMMSEAESNIKTYVNDGLCAMCLEIFGVWPQPKEISSVYFQDDDVHWHEFLPELSAKEPKHSGNTWYSLNKSGWKQRIKLLKGCIEETM